MLLTLLVIGVGCKKTKLTGSKADYEGTWESNTTTLDLMANGRGSYNYDDGSVTKSINNGRLIIEGSHMKIKMIFKKEYHIDTAPTEYYSSYGDHYWYMILDGETFIKY